MFRWLSREKISRGASLICEECRLPYYLTPIEAAFYAGKDAARLCWSCRRKVKGADLKVANQ